MPDRTPKVRAPRFSEWTKSYVEGAFMLSVLGATEGQMATAFGVTIDTIKLWKKSHKEFKKACDDGTLGLVSMAAQSLAKRALGMEFDEEVAVYDRSSHSWVKTTKRTYLPPDPWSAARLLELKARNYNWSVTQNIQINNVNTNVNIELSELSTEQLQVLKEISIKGLPADAGPSND